ncbi:MAG: hypothetical protein ACTHM1_03005 [Solirubrobacteraceae bacterium]
MAMVEPEDRFQGAEDPRERLRRAEERCLDAEQRCFRAERRRFEAERQREQVQRLLTEARHAGLRMAQIVEELRRLVVRMHEAAEQPSEPAREPVSNGADVSGEPAAGTQAPAAIAQSLANAHGADEDGDRMVEALTAAIARLRANVEAVGETPVPRSEAIAHAEHSTRVRDDADSAAEAVRRRPAHKHSLSWIARWRIKRKQRKSA